MCLEKAGACAHGNGLHSGPLWLGWLEGGKVGVGKEGTSIAYWIAYAIEFQRHLLIAFGCLVEAFRMSFS